ncbi:MAG: hypothetical protein AAFU50_05890, partial [Pseudomonadota bacterium]
MANTLKRRGRPKGTGIDDDAKLQLIADRVAETGARPTTVIKELGWNRESDIRRLRDKLKSFDPAKAAAVADARRAQEIADAERAQQQQSGLAAQTSMSAAMSSRPAAHSASAAKSAVRAPAAPLQAAPEPVRSALPNSALRQRLDEHSRALAALQVASAEPDDDPTELTIAALSSAIATANFLAVQQAVFLAASFRNPLMPAWAQAAGRHVCSCCG